VKHDILGDVEQSDGHPFDATAVVRHNSRDIRGQTPPGVRITPLSACF
jgi:hypothetical protein